VDDVIGRGCVPVAIEVGALAGLRNGEGQQVSPEFGATDDVQAEIGGRGRAVVVHIHDDIGGVAVAVEVGTGLYDTEGQPVRTHFEATAGQAQVGSDGGGGVVNVHDVVGRVPVAIEVGASLRGFANREGHQAPIDGDVVDGETQVGSGIGGGVVHVENDVRRVRVAIEVRTLIGFPNLEGHQVATGLGNPDPREKARVRGQAQVGDVERQREPIFERFEPRAESAGRQRRTATVSTDRPRVEMRLGLFHLCE